VPEAVVAGAPAGALVRDTATMTLEETHGLILEAHARGQDVARVHSGDPSLYWRHREQVRLLRRDGVPFDITPGVPAYAAAAAVLGRS
jgi:precorrin-4/cobalt-precorrin-4 C11-methyltransferase